MYQTSKPGGRTARVRSILWRALAFGALGTASAFVITFAVPLLWPAVGRSEIAFMPREMWWHRGVAHQVLGEATDPAVQPPRGFLEVMSRFRRSAQWGPAPTCVLREPGFVPSYRRYEAWGFPYPCVWCWESETGHRHGSTTLELVALAQDWERPVPIWPIWWGLAANSAFFAALWCVPLLGASAARRHGVTGG